MKRTEEISLENILNRTLALFSKYGIKNITMDDVSHELGISKKTLYKNITDKRDLIKQVIKYEIEVQKLSADRMKARNLNAIDELVHVNRHIHASQSIHQPVFYNDLKTYYPDIYEEWLEYRRNRMYELILRNLTKGIEEGLFREDLNPVMIAKMHMAQTESMHTSGIVEDKDLTSSSFIDEVFTYHMHGICNEEGLKYFASARKNY